MDSDIGEAILITGAGSGIGRVLALDLAARGITVIAGVRNVGDAPSGSTSGARIHEFLRDVTEPGDPELLGKRLRGILGAEPLAAIVNNAGMGVGGPLEFVPIDDLRRQFEVNVFGQIAVTQAMLPLLRERGAARIVFVSSIGSRVAVPFFGPYSASKRALNAIADAWRVELAPWNIGVSVLIVAPVATPIWTKAASSLGDFQRRLPPTGVELYGKSLLEVARYVDKTASRSAAGADVVVRAARHAILAKNSRRTYLVGAETRVAVVLSRLLPPRAFDSILRGRMR
jgi:NAD(P)-dependent dehydrogenase (short-subunit alcohol dehydrogenase family)